jgi:hypothetical protein
MAVSTIDPNGLNIGQIGGRRNLIQNGSFIIDQRSSGSATTDNTNFNTVDRWKTYQITATSNSQAVSDVPGGYGFTKSLKTTVTATGTLGTSGLYGIWQVIEGYNFSVLEYGTSSARTSTISFWVKGSVTGTYGASIQRSNALDRQYGFTYTINSANTWEYKTVTIPGDTGGTWPTDNTAGATLMFMLGAGSSRIISTPEQWQAVSLALQPTGTVNLTGTLNATFQITGVQWEVGEPTPFEHRSYGEELSACMRFYQQWNEVEVMGAGIWYTANQVLGHLPFKQTMRAAPTITVSATNFCKVYKTSATIQSNDSSSPFDIINLSNARINIGMASNGTAGQGALIQTETGAAFYVDAEL